MLFQPRQTGSIAVAVAATETLRNNQPVGNETVPAALAPGNGSRCVAQWWQCCSSCCLCQQAMAAEHLKNKIRTSSS